MGTLDPRELERLFAKSTRIADVGGGKKPYAWAAGLDSSGKIYEGLDLDAGELDQAPLGVYSGTRVADICSPEAALAGRYDLIICRNTLEHVHDAAAAVRGLASMLAPGGHAYVKLPCRNAAFAQLNLMLPNDAKKRIMHRVFPHKKGDGFPAFYDQGVPSRIEQLAATAGLEKVAARRYYRSTYFSFFLPVYVLWRLAATMQYLLDSDYCESFEMLFRKNSIAHKPAPTDNRSSFDRDLAAEPATRKLPFWLFVLKAIC